MDLRNSERVFFGLAGQLWMLEQDINLFIHNLCNDLVMEFKERRADIAERMKLEHANAKGKGYCAIAITHVTPITDGTHALVWRRAVYSRGERVRSISIPRGKDASLSYPKKTLEKLTSDVFLELVFDIEEKATWIRRLNKALVEVRCAARALTNVGGPTHNGLLPPVVPNEEDDCR